MDYPSKRAYMGDSLSHLDALLPESNCIVPYLVWAIRPVQGFAFIILILKAKIDKDTIWGNIPIIFGALHNLLKAENMKLQGRITKRNKRKCKANVMVP